MVMKMTTLNNNANITQSRAIFIDTLSDESTVFTGYGIYAHISPILIEKLFNDFSNQSLPARAFAKKFVRTIH